MTVFLVDDDAADLGGSQGSLYEELDILCVVNHVEVLVAQLPDDTVHTASLHTDAGSYRVDTVVEALHCNLCALSWHACYLADSYESLGNLGHLCLEQALQEEV